MLKSLRYTGVIEYQETQQKKKISIFLCGFPNVNKVRKENICCEIYSQPQLASKAISIFIFMEYNFCLSPSC